MVKSRATVPLPCAADGRRESTPRLAEMIRLATDAKRMADQLGERFLSYLLAMVIQEMSNIDSRRAKRLTGPKRDKAATAPDT